MKKVTLQRLKNASLSIQSILEEVFPKEMPISEMETSLKDTLDDLQKLEEALFFKQEKLSTENRKYKEYNFSSLKLNQLMHLKESKTLKEIITLQNDFDNLLITERFLKFYEFIKNNLEINFELFIGQSNESEDFICFCLSELENDLFIGTKIRELKEKMEKYLINAFEESLDDPFRMKSVYLSSYYLNQGYPLLKIYVNNFGIIKDPSFIERKKYDFINLDDFKLNHEFSNLIEKIKENYKNEESKIKEIFFDKKRILNLINQRIFEDIIAANLDALLNYDNAFLFVNNLYYSFILVEDLYSYILNLFGESDNSFYTEELFSSYVSLLPLKERNSFDEIFDFLIFKKEKKQNYFMLNEFLSLNSDFKKIFKILIFLFYKIKERRNLFFKNEDAENYYDHFLRKFNEFFNFVISNSLEEEKMKIIDLLSEFYLVIKQILLTEENCNFDILTDFFISKVKKLFSERILLSETKVKKLFYEFSFSEYSLEKQNTDFINKLLLFLKNEIIICKEFLEGKNGIKFMILLMNSVYIYYYKKILSFKFNKESLILLNDTKLLLNFCKNNVTDVTRSYEYLLEIVQLICIDKNDLEDYYSSVCEKIPHEEAKKIFKCRIDYRTVKNILYKK